MKKPANALIYGVQIDALTKKVFVINVINIFLTKVWMST